MTQPAKTTLPAREALQRLREGNERWVKNTRTRTVTHEPDLAQGQSPFAVILGCADSRVPAEIVFDCGLGELFVVRVAGNVVAPSLVGSVEFAAAKFGTELVVVVGHTRCGAIHATLDVIRAGGKAPTDNLDDICARIAPSIRELVDAKLPEDKLVPAAIRANVRASVNQLQHGSRLLEQRVKENKLLIVGAEYSLETGHVHFLED